MTHPDRFTPCYDSQGGLQPCPPSLRDFSSEDHTCNGLSTRNLQVDPNDSKSSTPLVGIRRKPLSSTRLTKSLDHSVDSSSTISLDSSLTARSVGISFITKGSTQELDASREFVDGLDDDSTTSLLDHIKISAPDGWPKERSALPKNNPTKVLEMFFCILLASGAMIFLCEHFHASYLARTKSLSVLAILAARVENTFLGDTRKYIPGQAVVEFQSPKVNGSIGEYIKEPFRVFLVTTFSAPLNSQLLEAVKFGPSFFPILFSAILSTTLRSIARWKAERGCKLEVSLLSLL
jgi:hypothetical protein